MVCHHYFIAIVSSNSSQLFLSGTVWWFLQYCLSGISLDNGVLSCLWTVHSSLLLRLSSTLLLLGFSLLMEVVMFSLITRFVRFFLLIRLFRSSLLIWRLWDSLSSLELWVGPSSSTGNQVHFSPTGPPLAWRSSFSTLTKFSFFLLILSKLVKVVVNVFLLQYPPHFAYIPSRGCPFCLSWMHSSS